MIVPTFADIGKTVKDLFEKNFHFGFVKVEHKCNTTTGVQLTTSGNHSIDTGKIAGSLEAKYTFKKRGTTLIEKWNTSNVMITELTFEDALMKGIKQVFEATFEPNTGKKSAKSKSSFKNEYINLNCDLDFQQSVPNVTASTVVGYKGYLGGVSLGFDANTKKLNKHQYALAYQLNDFGFSGQVFNQDIYEVNIYQRLTEKLESAVKINWIHSNYATKFGAVTRYQVAKDAFFKFKIDNNSLLSAAYSFVARDGLTITLNGQLDAKSLSGGGHKLGLSLEFSS